MRYRMLFPWPSALTAVPPAPPYVSSLSSGCCICFACTRIWCVRPVFSFHCMRHAVPPAKDSRTFHVLTACLPLHTMQNIHKTTECFALPYRLLLQSWAMHCRMKPFQTLPILACPDPLKGLGFQGAKASSFDARRNVIVSDET